MGERDGPVEVGVHTRVREPSTWPPAPVPQRVDITEAAELIRSSHAPTPMVVSEQLSNRYGREVHLKLELLSPVRSFKHRGALVAVRRLVREGEVREIVTASTGNHGQGVAHAARISGVPVRVFAPASTAPEKLAAMRRLGADVNVSGADLDAAQEAGRAAASATTGAVYIEDGENPDLMAGAATVLGEMLDVLPDLDTVIVPLGGGNLLAGSLLARHAAGSGVDILAVQSQSAPGAVTSWLAGSMTPVPCRTFAGGLATSRPGELALSVMRRLLDSVAVVTDDDLYAAMAVAVATHGLHLEGAAAAPVAAMERCLDDISGERVGLVLTGNWMSAEELRRVNALTAAAEPG